MNESELEAELRTLSPVAPSTRLAERIEMELNSTSLEVVPARSVVPLPKRALAGVVVGNENASNGAFSLWRSLAWALGGAATACVAMLWLGQGSQPRSTVAESAGVERVVPVAIEGISETPDESVDEFISAEDQGLVYADDLEPQRRVRMVYLERHTWTNPQTGAVVELEVPREDIVLMSVAMQ